MNTDPADTLEKIVSHLEWLREKIISRSDLAEKGWGTLDEAADWTSFSRRFLTKMMAEGRLWHQRYKGRSVRIPRAHLDDQMAKGFPCLDMKKCAAEIGDLVHGRPVTRLIPKPKPAGPLLRTYPRAPPAPHHNQKHPASIFPRPAMGLFYFSTKTIGFSIKII